MSRKLLSLGAGWLLLAALFAAPLGAASGLVTPAASAPAFSCLEQIALPVSSEPTCGRCFTLCHSDPQCDGKHAGDLCSNNGATCQIFNGCGAHDCCFCGNAGLLRLFAPTS